MLGDEERVIDGTSKLLNGGGIRLLRQSQCRDKRNDDQVQYVKILRLHSFVHDADKLSKLIGLQKCVVGEYSKSTFRYSYYVRLDAVLLIEWKFLVIF